MRHYKTLFIDLDNTLYDFSGNSREAYIAVYNLLEYDRWFRSFEHYYEIYEEYNLRLWALYAEGKITKEHLNAERYSHPLRVVGAPDPEAIGALFWDEAMKRLPLGNRLMPHAKEILTYLRPKYKMYILSNGFTELQSRKMQSAGIAHYFDGMILSEDIGVNKPNPAIFTHALRVAESTAEESLMIGDNYEVDIEGAQRVGIDQVFYNISKKDLNPEHPQPTFTITSLLELKEIL
ncbi:MAG: YjjG family noncanonical pyrimidine nucleotidase [Bacteroidaceae bacterium]|nr:YjjG family noncanonical pyrimidine nucleotidase [Bacteroidaceae bacterium]